MLQQTQVATALPFYERWVARFPTVASLADASEDEVLAMWQGLGYYRRCRMFHSGAKAVCQHGFPTSESGWRSVPGVGGYTAAALASICLGTTCGVVDGNVKRVYARIAANGAAKAALQRDAAAWMASVIPREAPGEWNQAVMELGALVCRPKQPFCGECPVASWCRAHALGAEARFPVRSERSPAIELKQDCWVPWCDGRFGVRRIESGPWWRGMWEFPRTDEGVPPPDWAAGGEFLGSVRCTVTKHRIELRVHLARADGPFEGLVWLEVDALKARAMPSPQRKVLDLALCALSPDRAT